ncbi:MAG: dipicolinate synthase subunit DpsA, partial [Candidatus Ornithomonoglobus sp.]
FNTVPALILTGEVLEKVRQDTLIIDLASKPGGIDFDAAAELGLRVIWALSLPGRVAPVTAGIIIKDTITNILSEMEV